MGGGGGLAPRQNRVDFRVSKRAESQRLEVFIKCYNFHHPSKLEPIWPPVQVRFEPVLRYVITLCVFLVLRWQLSPTQMKCTCNANNSTYITLCFLIRMKYFGGHTQMLCTFFPNRVWLVVMKSLLSVPNADWFAFSDPTQP